MAGDRVIVVGAGVVGLTCAVRLLEAGLRVDVVARDLPRETTSSIAAALWYPHRALPQDRAGAWARTSYAAFAALAAAEPGCGVRMVPGVEVLASGPRSSTAPVADMGDYLDWLARRVAELGGTITRLNLSALPDTGLVVNCAGLGARLLAADRTVVPVRGQVAIVEQVGLDHWWVDAAGPTYVVPRERDIVVGGTEAEGEWSRTPSPDEAEAILERAVRLVPALRDARVLRHRVGLRPARPAVRVERVGDVVHCYGHGGAGFTLSWGVADEVASLVRGDQVQFSTSG